MAKLRVDVDLADHKKRTWEWCIDIAAFEATSVDARPEDDPEDGSPWGEHPQRVPPREESEPSRTWAEFELPRGYYHIQLRLSPRDPSARTNRSFTATRWLSETPVRLGWRSTRLAHTVDVSEIGLHPPIPPERLDAPKLGELWQSAEPLVSWLDRFYLGPFEGYGEEQIVDCEARLGCKMPPLLRSVYEHTGHHGWASACSYLLPPDRVTACQGKLVFFADQQDCAFWAVSLSESDDPEVFITDGEHFEPEGVGLAQFFRGIAIEHRLELAPSLATPWPADHETLVLLSDCDEYLFATGLDDSAGAMLTNLGVSPPDLDDYKASYDQAGLALPQSPMGDGRYFLRGGAVFQLQHMGRGATRVRCGARTREELATAMAEAGLAAPKPVELDLWSE